MPDLMFRSRFVWSGWSGGPGYTTFYGNGNVPGNAQAFATAAFNFMNSIKTLTTAGDMLPSTVRIDQDAFLTTVEATNGKEQGVVPITVPLAIVGTSSQFYVAPSGIVVNWITPNFINGRRVRGKTYLVPLVATAFSSNGTPSDSYLTKLRNDANAFITSGQPPVVWHRPTFKGATDGSSTIANAVLINDHAAVLRTRRG